MFDLDKDSELKDQILQMLIDHMEDRMGDSMRPGDAEDGKHMAVEVAAPDKAHLAEGLDKAKEVLAHAPDVSDAKSPDEEQGSDEDDDADRLAELLGESDDDEDDEDDKAC